MKKAYINKRFHGKSLTVIRQANAICAQYAAQGLSLTLRQLYYQFVARDLIPNQQSEYKRLGSILNDARMAGEMDWDYLIDRTRNLESLPHWTSPSDIIDAVSRQYRTDLWEGQHQRVEVWIEKDAGIGVIEAVCQRNDVAFFSCRGYTSVSEIHAAAMRLYDYIRAGEQVTILHVGDHDPSGLDMSRDIEDRLKLFIYTEWADYAGLATPMYCAEDYNDSKMATEAYYDIELSMIEHLQEEGAPLGSTEPLQVKRIALNYDQVLQYNPPPNPAKQTDARFQQYVRDTGLYDSWELDALDPIVLQNLIEEEIARVRDLDVWDERVAEMEREKGLLRNTSRNWDAVADYVEELAG